MHVGISFYLDNIRYWLVYIYSLLLFSARYTISGLGEIESTNLRLLRAVADFF